MSERKPLELNAKELECLDLMERNKGIRDGWWWGSLLDQLVERNLAHRVDEVRVHRHPDGGHQVHIDQTAYILSGWGHQALHIARVLQESDGPSNDNADAT